MWLQFTFNFECTWFDFSLPTTLNACGVISVCLQLWACALWFQFAYNFERVWYMCSNGNWQLVSQLMKEVETDGKTTIPGSLLKQVLSSYLLEQSDLQQP